MADVADRPPNADESYRTVNDDIWFLERHTADGWTVTDADYPDPNHGGQVCLAAVLEHEAGHEITCTPIDPWESSPGPTLLRAHRIRLDDAVRDESTYYAFGEVPYTLTDIEQIYTQPAEKVAETDRLVGTEFYGKGTTASSLATAKACIIAAARDISKRYQRRQQWF